MMTFVRSRINDFLWISVSVIIIVECKKCMRNDDIGWRQGNIYYCDNPKLPECCEVDRKFTCCEPGPTKTFREQLQLWGTVVLFCIVIGVIYLYYKRDSGCCVSPTLAESFRSLKGRFIVRKKFHPVSEQYQDDADSTVKLTSADMHSDKKIIGHFVKSHHSEPG